MARPLRKCTTDGSAYTRPPEIEAAIDEALALDATTRLARAEILDRKAPGFLPKEALVYLIRDAKRVDDQTTLSKLFTILARRCEEVLAHQVPDTYPNAVDIRADALSELGNLVAEDETGTDGYRLDFFESRFESAFLRLWTTIARKCLRRREREVVAADPDNPVRKPVEGALEVDGEQEPTVLRKEQMVLFNRLAPDDRKLLFLRFGNEVKVESNDPAEVTLAKIYRVEGRTIRNRINAALARLATLETKP
ncbi:hypothetical protein [Sandaracinus amylolyticus]|uniref:hypothetical protein n=1 Tax=Sandaracinus amylolyticus TaxID=927083 RepID=UPI001F37C462|nr:hypothetical protein [Sandaracinus amylolyticus]UJR83680.1 Hypothetical protein I5071_57490 [Sandaracinus amylolyticus]